MLLTASADHPVPADRTRLIERLQAYPPASRGESLLQRLYLARLQEAPAEVLLKLEEQIGNLGEAHPWIDLERGRWLAACGELEAARRSWSQALAQAKGDLVLLRQLDRCAPGLVQRPVQALRPPLEGARVAVVIPGELRCWARNADLVRLLARHGDVFVCTTAAHAARPEIRADGSSLRLRVTEDDPTLPMASMQQWMRLAQCLSMAEEREEETGLAYTHILKLRTDYCYADPQEMLKALTALPHGILACSDKVFGGDRTSMMVLKAFAQAMLGLFDERESQYFPVNVEQILTSADSFKWFGMPFPRRLVGSPRDPEELRRVLQNGGKSLAHSLLTHRCQDCRSDDYLRFFQGHERFASEVSFARFLNLTGIRVGWDPSLAGFLWGDRTQALETGRGQELDVS